MREKGVMRMTNLSSNVDEKKGKGGEEMDKKKFQESVFEVVKNVPIEEVADMRLDVVREGRNYKALCPFHNDSQVGSFILGGRMNLYKCFSCGAAGNGIQLISYMDGVGATEAAFRIALDKEIVTQEQVDMYHTEGDTAFSFNPKYTYTPNEEDLSEQADVAVLDKVFRIFSRGNELLPEGGERLSERHVKLLKQRRHLTDEDIKRAGFFTFPSLSILGKFYLELYEKHGFSPNILERVPGFFTTAFLNLNTDNFPFKESEAEPDIKGYLFKEISGLGIPIRNADGQIVGIQIRLDRIGKAGRYVWFSSSWADGKGKTKEINGTSAGSPKDVVYPETLRNTTLFITEGKFKAMKIAKDFGSIAISIQGVSSWYGIEKVINGIKDNVKPPVQHILIAYDADMSHNMGVAKQAVKMATFLGKETGLDIQVALWDVKYGKGIDDMMILGHADKLVRMPHNEFAENMTPLFEQYEETKGKTTEEELDALFHRLVLNNATNRKTQMRA